MMFEIFNLSGKVAIVAGGGGGIGHAIAVGLAKHGADVVVTSRTLSKLEPVSKEIQSLGRKSEAIAADVTDEKSIARMVERVMSRFSRIDILVNAAGISLRSTAEEFPIADWKKVMDFNVVGTFICCQAVGRVMIKQKGGKIINLSSIRGRFGAPMGGSAYSPSKGAVDSLTRTLAVEWAKYNILVNAIAPAVVHTELTQAIIDNKELAKSVLSRIPLGRFALPEDMVGPTVFLASEASNFMTGQIVYVDGGSSCA
jgi:NAD(P)-dependent dehydrogenase (short-subunit alcohol dehydrogenase family)